MGELLNGLLRAGVIALWFLVVGLGIYVSASGWSADYTRDAWSYNISHTQSQTKQAAYKRRLALGWPKLAFYLAKKPQTNWRILKQAFPFLQMSSQRVGQGNFAPQSMSRERFIWHILPGPFIALFFMLIIEFGIYPMLRHKLAHSLATQANDTFGSAADLPRGDGFVLSRNVRLARNAGGNPHVLTIGPSGNGKSACQVLPSLLQLPDDCAVVVTDPKAELLARAAPYLQSKGHKIIVLGPLSGYGHGWDPMRECASADDVRELARQLIAAGDESNGQGSTSNWNNMSRTCLSAYLIQAHADGLGLADGLQSLYADEASGKLIVNDAAHLDYRLFESMSGSGATVGSIMATIQGACSIWLSDKVVGFMAHQPTFSMSDIRSKKAAVFLVSSASDSKAIRPFQWLFFTRLFSHLAEGGQTDVRLMLDEMANLGALEGIDQALNLLRGAGVQMHGFVQNLSQLKAVYGSDIADVVAASFGTISVMSGLRKDAKQLAELLGLQGVVRPSYSTMDENMRAQFSANDKQAMEGALLRQIQKDEVLIISGNKKPVIAIMKPWYDIKRLKDRVAKPMQDDWGSVPESSKAEFFSKFPKINPVGVVLPPKKKKKVQGRKPKADGGVNIPGELPVDDFPVEVFDSLHDENEEKKEDWDDLFR